MGSSSSKFRKHLQNGDEYAALQLYNNNADLRKGLDPNSSYGDNYNHDTPLHFAARHSMKSLLRIFLFELGGNPNKKNGRNETALHVICIFPNCDNFVLQQRRSECLALILQWKGATLQDGQVERVELGAQDEKLNTALHYAAASGLKRCVELLVAHNTPLFTENAQKQTPCDCAEKSNKNQIALFLESKMVFTTEQENIDEDAIMDQIDAEEQCYSGLRAQDLQEAKDQLLVETSDMLRVPLFTAEALLRNHEWSRETLLEAWMDDPIACCEKCGVIPPSTIVSEAPAAAAAAIPTDVEPQLTPTLPPAATQCVGTEVLCDICTCLIPTPEEPVSMTCDHQFCRSCWERYLTGKITEGEAHNIYCPGYQCCRLVPVDVIETLVSRDMARRYLQFDIKAFVDSNPSIKWCPFPGCGRAVRLPDSDNPLSPSFRGMNDMRSGDEVSHAVDCGNGHIFCWECLGEAHEPACCDKWKNWHQKVAETKPEEMSGTEEETEVAANCLWLVTNSKPCPNCKSPIQKNEGCNHMKCSKCKHDFCWVCLEAWKKHSSATGGYFRCNRYEVVKKVGEYSDLMKHEAEARSKRLQELNRFVHYYTRFKNHENSFKLEEPLISTAKEKMLVLAKAVTDPDSANLETKFVEEAVHQLLKARRVLKCSYVYGYYLDDSGYKKPIFEFMQTELEECTETLSEMIARPYLRTPRSKIILTAHLVQRKRHEFVTAIAKGLVPPDSSPTLKKKRKKYSVELDDDLRKALMASMQDLDPANPWVKDPSGKHTNVSALLDWPEESDESENEMDDSREVSAGAASVDRPLSVEQPDVEVQVTEDDPEAETLSISEPPVCLLPGCSRPRAKNPRTGLLHDHCSQRCMRMDQTSVESGDAAGRDEPITDYQIDLLRALEMSRLQFLREMGSLRPGSGERSPCSPHSPVLSPPQVNSPTCQMLQPPVPSSSRGPSPVPGTSSRLVLCEPPRGRTNRRNLTSSEGAINDEERDLRLAIELSLQESLSPKPADDQLEVKSASFAQDGASSENAFTYDVAEYSSIVNRVPNKSVEDLAVEGSSDHLGACARSTSPAAELARSNNPFGLLKDISVSNILSADTDKTRTFADKDFSQVFSKKMVNTNPQNMEQVFEPRPPHPPTKYMYQSNNPWKRRDELQSDALTITNQLSAVDLHETPASALDPADIIISSEVLESLLQGAELYTTEPSPEPPEPDSSEPLLAAEMAEPSEASEPGAEDDQEGEERKGIYV